MYISVENKIDEGGKTEQYTKCQIKKQTSIKPQNTVEGGTDTFTYTWSFSVSYHRNIDC